jgi:hypothetical protein
VDGEHPAVDREDEVDREVVEVDEVEGSRWLLAVVGWWLLDGFAGGGGKRHAARARRVGYGWARGRKGPREKKIRVVTLYPTGFIAKRDIYMHRHCTVWGALFDLQFDGDERKVRQVLQLSVNTQNTLFLYASERILRCCQSLPPLTIPGRTSAHA